jgi:hypothetical protein
MVTLIITAKMNDVDSQAWLGDVLARIAGHPVQKLDKSLPWIGALPSGTLVKQLEPIMTRVRPSPDAYVRAYQIQRQVWSS